jgi:AraC-like DNA-binding protein
MLPSLKKISTGINDVFEVLIVNEAHFYPLWHYHPQFEIMLIEKGFGTRYVGDNVSTFKDGDITFLGSNIPHLFRNYPEYYDKNSKRKSKATVLYFCKDFADTCIVNLKELTHIKELLEFSKRGLAIKDSSKKEVARRLYRTVKKTGVERLLEFIAMLSFIATEADYKIISSAGFHMNFDEKDVNKLNKIFSYLLENFSKKITLDQIAGIANMSPTAFCRYFKERTNKTFITLLNEIRIGNACKYLIQNEDMNISQICFLVGFNNLTNFSIQFKNIKNITPLEYRNKYRNPNFAQISISDEKVHLI